MEIYINKKHISDLIHRQSKQLGRICKDNGEKWTDWIKHPIARTRAEMRKKFAYELMELYKHGKSANKIMEDGK